MLHSLAPAQSAWTPSSVFIQGGGAQNHTQSATVGLTWDLDSHWQAGTFDIGAYVEASLSDWRYHTPTPTGPERTNTTQFAVIPTLRVRPDHGASPWFAEVGIGATLTSKLYQTEGKRFSTRFNFGDHLAVGRNFGTHREHELALRYEHFSNADIKRPNPGEDFLQVRYAYRFQ